MSLSSSCIIIITKIKLKLKHSRIHNFEQSLTRHTTETHTKLIRSYRKDTQRYTVLKMMAYCRWRPCTTWTNSDISFIVQRWLYIFTLHLPGAFCGRGLNWDFSLSLRLGLFIKTSLLLIETLQNIAKHESPRGSRIMRLGYFSCFIYRRLIVYLIL